MKYYITRKQLRDRGFTQAESLFVPLLEKVNQQVATAVAEELKIDIAHNRPELLKTYLGLLESKGFNSPITQHWLEERVPEMTSIEADWREIILSKMSGQV